MIDSPLLDALEIVGSQVELAARIRMWHESNGNTCRVKQAHVWKWLHKHNGAVPADHVLAVAQATDWKQTPHQLRPDLYPHPDDGLPEHMRRAA